MSNLKKNILYFSQFATGQFFLQALNILNGFFLLRWLSISQQAKFSVAFGIQSLILNLSDLGFTGSIIALVGNRFGNKRVVGAYIQSAKRLRNYLFFFSCGVVICILPFIIKKQSWSYYELLLILIPVLLAVFWQADCSLYDSTLVMHKKMKELYRPQIIMATIKLSANYVMYSLGVIGAFTTLILNALAYLFNGKTYKRKAAPYVEISTGVKNEHEYHEMISYLKPLFPGLIFNAFYGQIQIFLISFFGKTANIADVAALGKLSQIFLFLASLNGMLISPLMARTNKTELFKKYLLVLSFSFFIALCVFASVLLIPDFFLYLLGPKFYHLKSLLNIMILNACLSYLINTIWVISSARKWIFWWGTIAYITTIIVCQIGGAFIFNLSTTLGILQLTFITSVGIFIIHLAINIVGLKKDTSNKIILVA